MKTIIINSLNEIDEAAKQFLKASSNYKLFAFYGEMAVHNSSSRPKPTNFLRYYIKYEMNWILTMFSYSQHRKITRIHTNNYRDLAWEYLAYYIYRIFI